MNGTEDIHPTTHTGARGLDSPPDALHEPPVAPYLFLIFSDPVTNV